MPAATPRPRARKLAMAAGAAITVALTAAFPATALAAPAHPATSAPAPSVAAAPFTTPRLHPAVTPLSAFGTGAGSTAKASPRVLAASSTPVSPAPSGSYAPAAVHSVFNPDSATPFETVVGDVQYGLGWDPTAKRGILEQWTGTGWARVSGAAGLNVVSLANYDGTLYFSTFAPSEGTYGSSMLYSFDGTTASPLHPFTGFLNVLDGGTSLVVSAVTNITVIQEYNGTSYTAAARTSGYISSVDVFDNTAYVWKETSSTSNEETLYRVDPGGLTKITQSPYSYDGVEWNGAFYFGGFDDQSAGVFKFDGSTVSKVDVGDVFANSFYVPNVGAVGNRLFFATDDAGATTTLYSYDGGETTSLGVVGPRGSFPSDLTAQGDQLFMRVDTQTSPQTWIYNASPTLGEDITSAAPTVSGTVAAGKTLSAVVTGWTPTANFTYQWNRDDQPITGATGASYLLGTADFGHTISVTVTGAQTGYTTESATSADTTQVATGTMTLAPAITGTYAVGQTLAATTPGLNPSNAALTYQWLRDGEAITGATAATYKLSSSDVKHTVTVTVSATATGFTAASKTSAGRVVGLAFSKSPVPAVLGTFSVGHTISLAHGTWSPTPTFHYQWFRSGVAIKGATGSTYKITTADRGHSITGQVIGSKTGYTTIYKMSGAHTIK